jgi:uncharacterized protein (TIGR03435 family)
MGKTMAAAILLGASLVQGQIPHAQSRFEAASVKIAATQDGTVGTQGGPGSRDPEHYSARVVTLRLLLCTAYATADCQEQISGPGWLDTEKYDVEAKVPPGTTKEQFQKMLQDLLTERFKLAIRRETKSIPVYDLVVAKSGPKFRESVATPEAGAPAGPPAPVEKDKDGFPILPPGRPGFVASYGPGQLSHWRAQRQPLEQLAKLLSTGGSGGAGRQVIDKTGLTGKYDFTLVYDMHLGGAPGAADDSPNLIIFDAVEKQLGLKLVDGKAPFDFFVIERAERVPLEN